VNGDNIDLYFSSEKLANLVTVNKISRYAGNKREGYQVFNMSLLSDNEKLKCLIRNSSFDVGQITSNPHLGQESYVSNADIIDDKIINEKRIYVKGVKERTPYEYHGLEDPRYFKWRGREYALCVKPNEDISGSVMVLLDLQSKALTELPDYLGRQWNKNWVPYIYNNDLYFISDIFPTIIYKFEDGKIHLVHHTDANPAPFAIHGSSNIFDYKGKRTALVHGRFVIPMAADAGLTFWFYWHAFVQWDDDWVKIKMGRPFYFEGTQIEFSTSVIEHQGKILITYSVRDWGMNILEMDYDELEKLL
jgi:hypothetical protein